MGWEWSPSHPQGVKRYRLERSGFLAWERAVRGRFVQIDRGHMDGWIDGGRQSDFITQTEIMSECNDDNLDLILYLTSKPKRNKLDIKGMEN